MAKSPQNQEQEEKDRKEEKEEEEDEEEDEESSSPPSKVARVSSDPGAVTMAVASPLGLGLGLGGGGGGGGDESLTKTTGFTFMQMQEYHHQDLIFKHLVAGVPVPIHLILPIWKSVAASYGPHHYPSFAGLGNLCYDFRNSMEPEPGRCRRTDGKKWRCSRDVVPEQKYCERHMHRGRNRSRKPVEGAGTATTTTATAAADPLNTSAGDGGLASKINNNDVSNGSTTSGSNVTIARIGSSPISVLSSSTCEAGASKRMVL